MTPNQNVTNKASLSKKKKTVWVARNDEVVQLGIKMKWIWMDNAHTIFYFSLLDKKRIRITHIRKQIRMILNTNRIEYDRI